MSGLRNTTSTHQVQVRNTQPRSLSAVTEQLQDTCSSSQEQDLPIVFSQLYKRSGHPLYTCADTTRKKQLISLQAVVILHISSHSHFLALIQRWQGNKVFWIQTPLGHCCVSQIVLEWIPNPRMNFWQPFTACCFHRDKEQRLENLPYYMTVATVFTKQERMTCTFRKRLRSNSATGIQSSTAHRRSAHHPSPNYFSASWERDSTFCDSSCSLCINWYTPMSTSFIGETLAWRPRANFTI